jgi:hypothetical protein
MSYEQSLEAAGATILEFESFGSWQGEWVALVEYRGERGWVQGSFGSCSHCDSFEAEFGWDDEEQDDYQERLASFGQSYLDGLQTTQAVVAYFDRSAEWDEDSQEAATWVRAAAERYEIVL